MISEERAEKALRFLVDTDERCAEAKADMERSEYAYKRAKEMVFIHAQGTVAERQATAAMHLKVKEAHEHYVSTIAMYSHIANKRDTERIVLDMFRTLSANKRMGS